MIPTMHRFYKIAYNHQLKKIFLIVHKTEKRSMGLSGYCKTLISAICHAELPLYIDRTKLLEILSPGNEHRCSILIRETLSIPEEIAMKEKKK